MAYLFVCKNALDFNAQEAFDNLKLNVKYTTIACAKEYEHSYLLVKIAEDNNLSLQIDEFKKSKCLDFDILYLSSIPSIHKKGLLVMDMDMTSVQIEGIDELARCYGVYDEVCKITHEAMNGKLDFNASLIKRVSLLKGADSKIIDRVIKIMKITEGFDNLVKLLKDKHWKVAIASGGFTNLIDYLAKAFNIDYVKANTLRIVDNKLTGDVVGTIVDAKQKAIFTKELLAKENIEKEQSIVIGDGANDILMMQEGYLSLAYHAKEKAREHAKCAFNFSNLNALVILLKAL